MRSCFKCSSQSATRERRCIRFALDEFFAGELHDHASVRSRGDETVVLLSGYTGQRLEPVSEVCSTFFSSPILHGIGDNVGDINIQRKTFINSLLHCFVSFFRETGLHDLLIKNHVTKDLRYVCHSVFLL